MEVGERARRVGLDGDQPGADPVQQPERQRHPDQPVDEVADRKAAPSAVLAGGTFEQRVDRGTEIGAEHQGEGGIRRHHALFSQRHHQQHDRDAGMCRPGQHGGQQDGNQRFGRDTAKQQAKAWHVLVRRDQFEQLVQCQHDQAEADQHAAEIPRAGFATTAEHHHTAQQA